MNFSFHNSTELHEKWKQIFLNSKLLFSREQYGIHSLAYGLLMSVAMPKELPFENVKGIGARYKNAIRITFGDLNVWPF